MSTGIAGDNSVTAGAQTAQLTLVELRVLNQLIQAQQGTVAIDPLPGMRNDEAIALSITPLPVPGIS